MAETKNKKSENTKEIKSKTTTRKKTSSSNKTTITKKEVTKDSTKSSVKSTPKKTATTKKNTVEKTQVKKTVKKSSTTGTKKVSTKKVVKKASLLQICIKNLAFIKNNFLDVFLLYRNFIHWNISKIIILLWSIILGFIAILPLVIIFIIYSLFSDVTISKLIQGIFNGILLSDIFGNVLLVLIILVYFVVFSFSNILFMNLNNSYFKGKKLDYKKNDYFDVKKIFKFFNLSLVNIGILSLPIIFFIVSIGVLFFVAGGVNGVTALVAEGFNNYFSVLSFLFLVISLIALSYLYYRTVFSYFVFVEKYNSKTKVFDYIKESFSKTKSFKDLFKFVVIIFLFLFITSPINYIGQVLENNDKYLNDYIVYSSITEEQKTLLSAEDQYYFQALDAEFSGLSVESLSDKLTYNFIYLILFTILDFIFLYSLFVMIFFSFYKRELS